MSNNPLPTEPQRWKGEQFIFYFNHRDNGEQPVDKLGFSKDGNRYEAEYIITDSLEEASIKKALTRYLLDPLLHKCVVENIEVENKEAIKIVKIYKPDSIVTAKITGIVTAISAISIDEKPMLDEGIPAEGSMQPR